MSRERDIGLLLIAILEQPVTVVDMDRVQQILPAPVMVPVQRTTTVLPDQPLPHKTDVQPTQPLLLVPMLSMIVTGMRDIMTVPMEPVIPSVLDTIPHMIMMDEPRVRTTPLRADREQMPMN